MSQVCSLVYTMVEENIGERIRGRGVGERGGRAREEIGEKRGGEGGEEAGGERGRVKVGEEEVKEKEEQKDKEWTSPDVWPERTSLMMLVRCFGLIHIRDRMNSSCNTVCYCTVFLQFFAIA